MSTIPESPETIETQLQWLREGKRQAVLLTPGCAWPELPVEMELLNSALGVFVYNPALMSRSHILKHIYNEELGLLLGYGVPRKTEDGGRKAEDGGQKAEAEGSSSPPSALRPPSSVSPLWAHEQCVTIRSSTGHEKQSVVVSEGQVEQARRAADRVKDPEDTVQVEPPEKVIEERLRDLTERDLKIYPIATAEQLQRVETAARENGNPVLRPTHFIERNGEIIGCIGLNVLPMARIWLHTGKVKASDSKQFVSTLAGSLSMAGHRIMAVVINRESPFYKVKERFGFVGGPDDSVAVKLL